MDMKALLEYTMIAQTLCAWGFCAVLIRKKLIRGFSFLAAYAAVLGTDIFLRTIFFYFREVFGLSRQAAFNGFFYTSWTLTPLEQALMLCAIYQIFSRAMTPFRGLRRMGLMVFRWVCAFAIIVTVGITAVPGHVTLERYMNMTGQFAQGISVLTVCILLFVCFAIRQLGMTFRSHLFGASLGLGILGTISLVQCAWYAAHGQPQLYSFGYVAQSLGSNITLLIWGTYFILPEPKKQMVLLPTTSPYFHWNQISEALGDDPGVVAVAGFTPESLSEAERLVLGASSARREARPEAADLNTAAISQKPKSKVRVRVATEQAVATGTQR